MSSQGGHSSEGNTGTAVRAKQVQVRHLASSINIAHQYSNNPRRVAWHWVTRNRATVKMIPGGSYAYGGIRLDFEDLGFTVQDRASGHKKAILSGITGSCVPGRLFALMGGSN